MAIVIKKRISLDFLGEDYKEAYLVFKTIPVSKIEETLNSLPTEKNAGAKVITGMTKILQDFFDSGKFPDEEGKLQDVSKDDIADLDADSSIHCFKVLTGQDDPKVGGQ